MGFPGGSDGKGSACSAGDPASTPGLERSPGEGNGNHASIFFSFSFYQLEANYFIVAVFAIH